MPKPLSADNVSMTVQINKTANGTAVRISGVSTTPQRVEIVPGSAHEGGVVLQGGSTVSGVVITVRPA
jgi:hypothetical protein